jgi:hypothetical protein
MRKVFFHIAISIAVLDRDDLHPQPLLIGRNAPFSQRMRCRDRPLSLS